jgi:Reverse transcriptase (RNA-dependent DNA polymerase)
MFINHYGKSTIIILVYVDDIIITENDNDEIKKVKQLLKNEFDIKNLGTLSYFLGIEIVH